MLRHPTLPAIRHKTTVQVLTEARDLIRTKGHCKHFAATDRRGLSVDPLSLEAASFCAIGAVVAAAGADAEVERDAYDALREALTLHYGDNTTSVAEWNDSKFRTPADVLRLFDLAIAEVPK